ncbi:MAG: hypothetical protein A2Y13_03445 [Planctomycetes bacterium GWC2_45_44]|nr:MAG: hypothetical protein A2Y13_03445 [Planctomycetes bacterium GWC2_45_44]
MRLSYFNNFRNPGNEYRSKPFWAWNGKLEPEKLRWQIRAMQKMGMGGFFMHSRVGLATEYLSQEWFSCIDACVDEAAKLGMEAWLYDEDRWPSGAAGGLVTKDPRYSARCLVLEQINKPAKLRWNDDVLAVFTAVIDGTTAANVKQAPRGRSISLDQNESILIFRRKIASPSNWFNGYTYLDCLNHEAVRKFIQITHEAYKKKFGGHFGKTIVGMFTDEPNHCGKFLSYDVATKGEGLPWTDKLPLHFKKRYGYDIIEHLPELFFDVDSQAVTPARHNYHDCATHLFVDAFARQIGQWCEKNNLIHTGHVLLEETLSLQTSVVGSCMRFYEYMQAPGMDILTEYLREYDTAKQVSSVARQFNKKWRLTETYGCTGWDFPFAGHKAIGDWQAALGINMRCQHLSWYTMEGEAKRDYPASIFFQSPWWQVYSAVEDYFARIHAVMTQGVEVRDLLVIHPVESMWTLFNQEWEKNPKVQRYDKMLMDLRDTLLAANIDFDYGDEDIISRHAKIAKTDNGHKFMVGCASYKTVVVPSQLTMRATTLKLLKEFAKCGGTVIFAGTPAEFVDARPSEEVVRFASECINTSPKSRSLLTAVESKCRRISISSPDGNEIVPVLHLLRESDEAFYLFICNIGHDFTKKITDLPIRNRNASFDSVTVRLIADCKGHPIELDPQTGKEFLADGRRGIAGNWEVKTSLPKLGSRLFVFPKKQNTSDLKPRPKISSQKTQKIIRPRWDILLSECNSLVLDKPAYRIGNSKLYAASDILHVDRAIRDKLGIPYRGGAMVQPWARIKSENPKSVPIELMYSFDADTIPSGDLYVAIENPSLYKIAINGVPVNIDSECGWWTDLSMRKISVNPAILRSGKNTLQIVSEYNENHPGLETVYILGYFGVSMKKNAPVITACPTSLKLGDWVKQGLAFYSGSVAYTTNVSIKPHKGCSVSVHIPDYKGSAVRVLVNGQPAGVTGWQPNEVDITDFIGDCANIRLGIEVFSHRRNSHGPFHHKDKHPMVTGPGTFLAEGKCRIDSYQLVSCGLIKPPAIVYKSEK